MLNGKTPVVAVHAIQKLCRGNIENVDTEDEFPLLLMVCIIFDVTGSTTYITNGNESDVFLLVIPLARDI